MADDTDGPIQLMEMFDLRAPQPRYRRMVAEEVLEPSPGFVVAASRAAVDEVFRDPATFSSEGFLDLGNTRPLIPLSVDPPRHVKYRKILDPLFAPKQMDAAEADITARVNHFMDAFVDRGHCNFTAEFATPFPSSVFLGLMGLPWEELDTFLRLKDGILRPRGEDGAILMEPDARASVARATGEEIYAYFDAVLDQRAAHPEDDILTRFLTTEIDGERLTREEILDICFLFLIAGLDTVTDSLTCFYAFLAQQPAHRRAIASDPSVIPNAVEELLRWESPVPGVPRMATRDAEVCGHAVTKGSLVSVSVGSANIDPAEFPDAFDVRFDRDVNRHLAFGGGVHRCLGSHLARRELRVTLREWHKRIPDYELAPGTELEYMPGLRSVDNLQLVW
jgi:cytochrome P450